MSDDAARSLEAAIDDDPDDTSAYSVYGDWLQRRGDLRGEWIALSLAADAQRSTNPRRRPPAQIALGKFLTKHARTLLGPMAKLVRDLTDLTAPPFIWRSGYIARAELGPAADRPILPVV